MRTGRNSPCPCGSGKKYKKCCQGQDTGDSGSGDRIADMHPVLTWLFDQEDLMESLLLLEADISQEAMTEKDRLMLLDAFIFDYRLAKSGKTPFERYLEETKLNASALEDYRKLLDNVYGLFEIKQIVRGKSMDVCDILDNKIYHVLENSATEELSVGNVLVTRIAQVGDDFRIIAPSCSEYPNEIAYSFKRLASKSKIDGKDRLSGLDVLRVMHCRKSAGLEETKAAFKAMLKREGIRIDLRSIGKRINMNTTPQDAFPEVYSHRFSSPKGFASAMELLTSLWNSHPRDEFGGKAPMEIDKSHFIETTLLQTALREVSSNINPERYPKVEDAVDAAEAFLERWISTPQEELDGRTPRFVILEERAKHGNPDKDIKIQINLHKANRS